MQFPELPNRSGNGSPSRGRRACWPLVSISESTTHEEWEFMSSSLPHRTSHRRWLRRQARQHRTSVGHPQNWRPPLQIALCPAEIEKPPPLLRKLVCPPFPLWVYFACILCSKPPGRLRDGCLSLHIYDEYLHTVEALTGSGSSRARGGVVKTCYQHHGNPSDQRWRLFPTRQGNGSVPPRSRQGSITLATETAMRMLRVPMSRHGGQIRTTWPRFLPPTQPAAALK